jgi:tetratricopeptide (TPR) repeat protein
MIPMTTPSPVETLAAVRASRPVIQDFCPLADSLEWRLGQSYLRESGNRAFTSDPEPVPFAVNNDGNLSVSAAEVLFAALVAAERAGTLGPDVFVLEVGIGVGLFARFFLDAFRALCAREGKDYYDRLRYVAGDYSEKMLRDAGRHGVFANHPGRYVLRVVDALSPERSLAADPLFGPPGGRPFHAVFLNYLLDCLPAAVLKVEGDEVRQLCVRSCLARGADLSEYCDLTVEELARLAASPDPRAAPALRRAYDLLASEYEYRPVAPEAVPYGEVAMRFARAAGRRSFVHSYGALRALERLLGLLRDDGLILVNDYGQVRPEDADDFQHQRYSQSTFVGVNFPLLRHYFAEASPHTWVEPDEGDNTSVHARLLARRLAPETQACFLGQLGQAVRDRLRGAVQSARDRARAGRLEAALAAYEEALGQQPYNWTLMNEVAHFLTFALRDPPAGAEMARAALACNPACSADLWNMLGDSLFELGRDEEARQAFLRALRINPDDARAHYNLTFVHLHTREYEAALRHVAEALALDRAGALRERLLQTQSEALARLTRRHQQESLRTANRVSARPDPPKPGGGADGAGSPAGGEPRPGEKVPGMPNRAPAELAGRLPR